MAEQKNKRGRPNKIDEQKLAEFKTFIIAGCTLKEACDQIEVSTMTWRRFLKKHPDYVMKFHKWKKELSIRAKLNLSVAIMNKKDLSSSVYLLDYQMKLKEKAAQVAVNRANAKKIKAQTKLLDQQLEQVESVADKSSNKMAQLDKDTLIRLSRLADGVDNE